MSRVLGTAKAAQIGGQVKTAMLEPLRGKDLLCWHEHEGIPDDD